MKKTFVAITTLLLLQSCSANQAHRRIANLSSLRPPELTHLLEASDIILGDVEVLNRDNCLGYLTKLEKSIDGMDVTKLPRQELMSDAQAVAQNSWKVRLTLHSKLPELGEACAKQAQANFRQLRFIEDYFHELVNRVEHKSPSDIDWKTIPVPMLEDKNFYVLNLRNPGPVKFESGDILITRGVSYLSAMIARMGDRNAQFSHIVMMNKTKSGEFRTIESYVGSGVGFYELNEALRNENARIFWIRAKDRKLATLAGDLMAQDVEKRKLENNHIKYDYELNFNDPKTMSCAEVSQVAFQRASQNSFKIPFYPNKISGGKSLMERLKIPMGQIYSPGDMEIDPRFEVLGEFTDLRLTRDSRQKDAILTKIYEWMDTQNYVLKDNFTSTMAHGPVYYARKTPLWGLVRRALDLKDFSKEIPKNMLSTVTLIDELGGVLGAELKKRDTEFEKKHGIPMTYMDFYRVLEEIRVQDLALYQNKKTRKQAKFHKIFGPK